MARKMTGINLASWHDTAELLKEQMDGGFAKTRSIGLSWVIADMMSYCYQEGLSFDHILKLGKTTFKWQTSRRCLRCRGLMSPDDVSDGGGDGRCVACIPPERK